LSKKALLKCPQAKQIVKVVRERTVLRKNKKSTETHYYITSLSDSIETLAPKIRGHWLVENQLHYVLDVQFGEDACRARKKNEATNLALCRKVAFNLVAGGASKSKVGIKKQRHKLALSDSRRDTLIKS